MYQFFKSRCMINIMYSKNNARIKTTSCGAVVWRITELRLELLLVKQFQNKNSWGVPKGHMHEGETLEQCAIREVKEEAGIQIVLGDRLSDIMTHFRNEDKTVVTYLATPVGSHEPDHKNPESEVADAKWFDILSLPRIHVYQRNLLEEAVLFLLKIPVNIVFNTKITEQSEDIETQQFREKIRELLKINDDAKYKR